VNYQQKAGSPGAHDACFVALLSKFDASAAILFYGETLERKQELAT
jgi:hypothetical protein